MTTKVENNISNNLGVNSVKENKWHRWTVGRLESLAKIPVAVAGLVAQIGKMFFKNYSVNEKGSQDPALSTKAGMRDLAGAGRLLLDIFVKGIGGFILAPSTKDFSLAAYTETVWDRVIRDSDHYIDFYQEITSVNGRTEVTVVSKDREIKDILMPKDYWDTLKITS